MPKLSQMTIVGLLLLTLLAAVACSPSPTATPLPTATAVRAATQVPATTSASTATPIPATPTLLPTPTAPPTPTLKPEILKIGSINPFTGSGAAWGRAGTGAVEVAADDINAKGGITVEGKQYILQVQREDDQYLAAPGMAAANKLIFQDKVKFFVGALASASVAAWTPVAEENKVINVVDTWQAPDFLQKSKYTFRYCDGGLMPPIHRTWAFFEFLKQKYPQWKTYVMTTVNDASGWGTAQAEMDAADAIGLTKLDHMFFERDLQDFRPIVTRFLALNPDVISITGAPPASAATLVKQFRAQGYKGKFLGSSYKAADLLSAGAANADIEGIISTEPANSGPELPPAVENFYKRYEAKFNTRDGFASGFYDMLNVLVMGIKKANSLDPDKVAAALESLGGEQMDLLWGKGWIGGKQVYGRNAQLFSPIPVSEIRNGVNVHIGVLAPKEVPPPTKKWF